MGMWSNCKAVLKIRSMVVIRDPNWFLAAQLSDLTATLSRLE